MANRTCGHCHRELRSDGFYCNDTCQRLYRQRQSERARAEEATGRSVNDAYLDFKVGVRLDPSAQAHLDRMIPDRNLY
ncbi:Mycobacterium numidiamassiliense ORFan [Mycobacterium numidiamassiliense]|uniref:Mycobacterium numidiamassiliense ORFan n=1 Tax=Mycobacterium numidiamassiliense TaxID=1841861 RepID=A0A2U3PIL5_9MYCO|nr:hypothetical protein [Mycobacterium numidiamassiliense]SPM43600.1 Mycobacterium numidiamassiliense ORFan [Mycobacterium numidiamassiliense]